MEEKLNILIMGDRQIYNAWLATAMEEVLREATQENSLHSLVYRGKTRETKTQYKSFEAIDADTLRKTNVVFLVGDKYVLNNLKTIAQNRLSAELHIVFVITDGSSDYARRKMRELGHDNYEIIHPSISDLFMRVVCEQQNISWGQVEKSAQEGGDQERVKERDATGLRIQRKKQFKAFLKRLQSSHDKSSELSDKQLIMMCAYYESNKSDKLFEAELAEKLGVTPQQLKAQSARAILEKKLTDRRILNLKEVLLARLEYRSDPDAQRYLNELNADNYDNFSAAENYCWPDFRFVKIMEQNQRRLDILPGLLSWIHETSEEKKISDIIEFANRLYDFIETPFLFKSGEYLAQGLTLPEKVIDFFVEKFNLARKYFINTQFFHYDPTPSVFHSRVERAKIINETLSPELSSGQPEFTHDQLIKLYAHYMSIGHIKSKLSLELEDKLINALNLQKHNIFMDRNSDRSTIRGKQHDRIAIALKAELEKKFQPSRVDKLVFDNIGNMIEILKRVDKLERSFWYKSNAEKIKDTIEYANQLEVGFYRECARVTTNPSRK